MPRRQYRQLPGARRKNGSEPTSHSIRPLLRERRERPVDLGCCPRLEYKQPPAESARAVLRGLLVEPPFWIIWIYH